MEDLVMVDMHQHPMVCPENMDNFIEYLHFGQYEWGYDAIRHGGWTAAATANAFRGMVGCPELSFIRLRRLGGRSRHDGSRRSPAQRRRRGRHQRRRNPAGQGIRQGRHSPHRRASGHWRRPPPGGRALQHGHPHGRPHLQPCRIQHRLRPHRAPRLRPLRLRNRRRSPHERTWNGRRRFPRRLANGHGRHRALQNAHHLQPQRLPLPPSHLAHPQGRRAIRLRQEGRPHFHYRRAQLPQRRSRTRTSTASSTTTTIWSSSSAWTTWPSAPTLS